MIGLYITGTLLIVSCIVEISYQIKLFREVNQKKGNSMKKEHNSTNTYKIFLDAEAYPNEVPKCLNMQKGDSIYIVDSKSHQIGDRFKNYNAVVTEVVCENKKWWQFWKRKVVYGYVITFE